MFKLFRILMTLGILAFLAVNPAIATQIWLDPMEQLYNSGDSINLDIVADIDASDAILGFDFYLSFDRGESYISAPGESGSFLTFTGFTPNTALFESDPAIWDDGDTISGEVPFLDPFVSGVDILLGTLGFDAPAMGPIGIESFYLGPPEGDYGLFATEGLIRGALDATSFMPNNPEASAAPVPEPATILLVASGMLGMGVMGRKKMRKKS